MLSANGDLFKSVTYPFVLSLSKHEWIIFRDSLIATSTNIILDVTFLSQFSVRRLPFPTR